MDLLGFARGPALKVALAIFCVGVVWRIVGFALLRLRRDLSKPRASLLGSWAGGLVTVGSRSWPHPEFIGRTGAGEALGYSYHIGLFIVVLLFGPHIVFLGSLFGFTWPGLPSSLITLISVLTLTLFLAVLFRRITNPVLRMLSNFDDYFSWLITALVLVTGLAATAHIGAPYEKLLAWHILSVDGLLVWFPFGKLMHAFYIFPSRAINGAHLARKVFEALGRCSCVSNGLDYSPPRYCRLVLPTEVLVHLEGVIYGPNGVPCWTRRVCFLHAEAAIRVVCSAAVDERQPIPGACVAVFIRRGQRATSLAKRTA